MRIVETRIKLMAAEVPLLATAWDKYAAASDYLSCTGEPRAAANWALCPPPTGPSVKSSTGKGARLHVDPWREAILVA